MQLHEPSLVIAEATILQPYLTNQDANLRGNSAIWQHPPIGTDQTQPFARKRCAA
jgi:hypothetical protein